MLLGHENAWREFIRLSSRSPLLHVEQVRNLRQRQCGRADNGCEQLHHGGLPRNLLRVWLAIHSSTSRLRQAPSVGAQLSMAVSGESAMVREGTEKPDAEAA